MKRQTIQNLYTFASITVALLCAAKLALSDETGSLSLDQALQEGVGFSPTLKKYESAKDEASWGTTLGFSGLLPHVSLVGDHDFSAQYESVPVSLNGEAVPVPIVFPRTSYGVEAQWTVFDGLANIHNYQASRDLLHASQQEYSRKDFEVRKKIESAYYAAIGSIRLEEVADENIKTLQENLTQVRNRYDAGRATEYDVLRVEVQMSNATIELERATDNVTIQRKKLALAMGLPEDARILDGKLPEPGLSSRIGTLTKPEISDRLDIQAARLRSEAENKKAEAASGYLAPSVAFKANYEHYDNTDYPAQAYGGFRDAWAVGMYLRWDVLDGGASIAKAGGAHASAARAESEYQEAVQTLPADFELWKRRYIYSEHAFKTKEQDLKRSEESFRIVKLSFQQGRNTITDVLEAENDLFRSRAGIVQSQLDAEEALVELELTIGKDF
jgi:outer membrane protein